MISLELSKDELTFLAVLFGPTSGLQIPMGMAKVVTGLAAKIEALVLAEKEPK